MSERYKPRKKRPRGEETVQIACNISTRSSLLLHAWAAGSGVALGVAMDKLVAREEMRQMRLSAKRRLTSSVSEIGL